jgi:hypothetical protein
MKFQRRKGVSVIIATLLLIAIAVAAGILVYVFVNGLAGSLTSGGGQQTTERLQMQTFNFALSPQACACTSQILQIFILNSGSSSTTISSIYYDGNLLTMTTPFIGPAVVISGIGYSAVAGNAYTAPSGTLVNDFTASTNTSCTSANTNGAVASMCFTAITTKTTYATGDVGQIVIPLSPAAVAGTSHTVKVVSTTGATNVFTVTAGRSG